jgi:hypothetical protein
VSQGENVTIAIIDGGARYTHESLQPSYRGSGSGGNVDHDYNWIDFAYHNKEVGCLSVSGSLLPAFILFADSTILSLPAI